MVGASIHNGKGSIFHSSFTSVTIEIRVIDSLWEKDGGQNSMGKWFDLLYEGAGQHSIADLLDSLL